jgi:AmiR/NasT family two-component response regulator
MARLQITASDIQEILKKHPEVEVEILDKAAAQVAETIARRVTNEQVAVHVDKCVADLVQQKTGWNTHKLAEPFVRIIHNEAQSAVEKAFGNGVSQMIRNLLSQEVENQMPTIMQEVTFELKQNLKVIIKEALVEILLTKT